MLAKRPMKVRRTAALVLLAIIALGFAISGLSLPARGDTPRIIENGDASRTVAWTMNTSQGLTLQGAEIANGNATLPWRAYNVTWDPSRFAANVSGTLDGNLSLNPSGISLRSDPGNHIADGDFATAVPWTYQNSLRGNVTAGWNQTLKAAVFRHDSPSTEIQWDSMDTRSAWNGVNGVLWTNTTKPHEGAGMLGLNFSFLSTARSYAGAQHVPALDWSKYDRMLVWVLPLNVSSPLTFNVTAFVGTALHGTIEQPLASGWHRFVVNLTELGSARSSLVSLTLRVNGQNVPPTTVYFDDLRVGISKRFDEVARIRQSLFKANSTTAALGSATLRFNWSLPNASGVVRVTGRVNVSGSSVFEHDFSGPPAVAWRMFVADVSSVTAAVGWYNITIATEVLADNTSASKVELRVDNVSLLFPNRHNGTYFSRPVPLLADSQFVKVNWSVDALGSTAASMSLRSGNDTNPGSPTWSVWEIWTSAGQFTPAIPSARFVQVRVALTTTNASVTPVLRNMNLETRHRAAQGSVASGIFTAPTDYPLLRWRTFRAVLRTPVPTNVSFSIGPGTFWRSVAPGASLSTLNWTTIQWNATLATSDGLLAPSLQRVELVYEFVGPVVRVVLTSMDSLAVHSGSWIRFMASALDAGSHVVTSASDRFSWTTSDPNGQVLNNGTYHAIDTGTWNVTATLSGTGYSAKAQVTVLPSGPGSGLFPYLPMGLLILVAGVLGYGGYEAFIRRMFAIEDVFLISKEGRLLMHNTRRMRADRDEDILSAMFTAILTFLKDFDREENGDLRRFEFGKKTALLERGDHAYLAAVYSGRVPRWAGKDLRRFMYDLERRFGETFARWSGDPDDLQGLKEFSERFVSRFRYRAVPRGKRGARRIDRDYRKDQIK